MTESANSLPLVIEKLSEYLAVPSVVGFERPLLKRLCEDFERLGFYCHLEPRFLFISAPTITNQTLLSVHVDRHGLIATEAGDLEYAAFVMRAAKYQEEPSASLSFLKRVGNRFIGEEVFAFDVESGAIIGTGVIEEAFISEARENMVFHARGLGRLAAGTPVSYGAKCQVDARGLRGQLDNAISISMVHELCRLGFGGRILFTCEEEIGRSWQSIEQVLERGGSDAVKLLVLDTSPFATDLAHPLDFVVLRNRDAHSLFDPALTEEIHRCAESLGIPVIYKDQWLESQPQKKLFVSYGSTELGRLIKATLGRWNGTTIQIPTIDYHTNREAASLPAIENTLKLLMAYLGIGSET